MGCATVPAMCGWYAAKTACWKFCCKSAVTRKILSPGCYDISSAGHIPAGQGFVDSALRELKEELGVTAQPQDLILCGQRSFQFSAVFHGKPFKDNQVSNVYLLWLDRDAEEFTLQKGDQRRALDAPLPTVCVMWRTAR